MSPSPVATAATPAATSTPHYVVLDGLRGLAALAVVVFHFMEFVVPDYTRSFIAHAYLAVDFFFCLSGFVIGSAYDTKLARIGVGAFLLRRLVRLHPLVLVGSVLGLLTFVGDPFSHLYATYGPGLTARMFLSSSLLVPYPLVHERYFNLFHLNPPTWSLFWEYMANVLYAVWLVHVRPTTLWLLLAVAAGALCYEASHVGNLAVGFDGNTFWGGAVRMAASFLLGLALYRAGAILPTRLGFPALGALLLLAFILPFVPAANWLLEPVVVLLYFPVLVALGAGAQVSARWATVCHWSGELSYPLYMVHYPFLWLFLSYLEKVKPSFQTQVLWIPVGTLLLLLLAYLVLVGVDAPARRYLRQYLPR
ncbi:acyltransferase [Hymenobacter setariae]|uniref:Acyltransferase n=1 Tax=Hymenobacter setariae TaxID=2594794 RepID=A0A558C3K1_9BACT|nr:acyltransferase [Hymenobacter setariae]TVT43340.1 acyltransferase [Hymenobacter setariae]